MRYRGANPVIAESEEVRNGTFVITKVGKEYELTIEYITTEPGGTDKEIWLASGRNGAELLAEIEKVRAQLDFLANIARSLP